MVLGLFKATLRHDTCLRVMPKNSSFSCFIAHSFWVSAGFACLERTLTCLRDMTRNSPFSRFMDVFVAIAHSLGVLGRFTVTFRPDTCWKDMTRNSPFSCFVAVFMSYCPQFYGSRAI